MIGPDGEVIQPFKRDLIRKLPLDTDVLKEMREAARSVVTLRHTYNLVDLPIRVAGKSGTAEFGVRDKQGRLPFHSWFVGFMPKNAEERQLHPEPTPTSSSWPSPTTRGPRATWRTEIVKYFLQLHYGIKEDFRNFDLLERGNFYDSN